MNRSELLQQLRVEVDDNDRLRLGLYAILGLLLIWVTLVASEYVAGLERQYERLVEMHADLNSVGDITLWQERFSDEREVNALLDSSLWTGVSENQTLAAIQSTLRKLTAESRLTRPSVRIGTPQWQNEEQGIKQVRTRIGGAFLNDDAVKLVALIEDFEPLFVVESLSIEVNQHRPARGNRVTIDVLAYYSPESDDAND